MQKKFKHRLIIIFFLNMQIKNVYKIAKKHVDRPNFVFDCTPTYDFVHQIPQERNIYFIYHLCTSR